MMEIIIRVQVVHKIYIFITINAYLNAQMVFMKHLLILVYK
jgi:hypothetical protein